jgi:hypothetical protein
VGRTRAEADFVAHLRQKVASDPTAARWHYVTDNFNTHCSEGLVCYVAEVSGLRDDLGIKGKTVILHSVAARVAFLTDPRH